MEVVVFVKRSCGGTTWKNRPCQDNLHEALGGRRLEIVKLDQSKDKECGWEWSSGKSVGGIPVD